MKVYLSLTLQYSKCENLFSGLRWDLDWDSGLTTSRHGGREQGELEQGGVGPDTNSHSEQMKAFSCNQIRYSTFLMKV